MRLQIDTDNKTIQIDEPVNLKELFSKVKKLLPSEWEGYTLYIQPIVYWKDPIIFPSPTPIYLPGRPFYEWPIITCLNTTSVYNIEF